MAGRPKFDAARHPRDRFGRFTKSRTVRASAKDKRAARAVADGFAPKQVERGERRTYLHGVAGDNATTFSDVEDANRALRAGQASPAAENVDAAMIALPDDLLLSRRAPAGAFGRTDLALLAGMKVRDAGFAPAQLGTVPPGDGQVRMHIAVPAGTRAAISPDTGEVLLDRDTEMVVAHVNGTDMYLTVLPKRAAPAGKKTAIPAAPPELAPEQVVSGEAALAVPTLNKEAKPRPPAYTPEIAKALYTYNGAEYAAVNALLRGGRLPYGYEPADVEPVVSGIDAAMAASTLDRDVRVWRGITNAEPMFGDRLAGNLTGMVWREDAYVSTSAIDTRARMFASGGNGVLMNILAPTGTPAVTLSGVNTEAEILLGRGHTFRVIADHGVVDGRRRLDVEMLPKETAA